MNFWTEDRIEELTLLWAQGFSLTRIGAMMGCSRSAAIGKIQRLKLPEPMTKQPVVYDVSYAADGPRHRVKADPEVVLQNRRAREKRYRERLAAAKRAEARQIVAANGAGRHSAVYRKHLPKAPEMTKGELRRMLTVAIKNTAALQ